MHPFSSNSAYWPFYSSHYAQAYSQQHTLPYAVPNSTPAINPHRTAPWCPPGHSRCTYKNCQFTGAPKTLEMHMMDRHLIFPPGWDRRPRKSEWDADPSLKGKSIAIQGTNISLDKPEDLEAWLAERKRRWPTTARVEEKKRKMDEAIARGQLLEPPHRATKRQRMDDNGANRNNRGRGRGRGLDRGRGISSRGRGRAANHVRAEFSTTSTEVARSAVPVLDPAQITSGSDSDPEDDDSPEVVSSKVSLDTISVKMPSKPLPNDSHEIQCKNDHGPIKRPPPQPRKEPYNPFASHSTLLRNLILPEIRMTISNLSQAIRFLVDNDFLDGVELTVGDAESKMIQVITDNDTSKSRE